MKSNPKLLAAIESCWAALAADVAQDTPGMSIADIERAARQRVELLVFLRMCGDRGLPADADVPSERQAGLPGSHLSSHLAPRDEASSRGARRLLFARAPDWLGRVHEHLLSRRLVRRAGDRFKVAATKTARKAAGVFYTPDYVVRYIVDNALTVPLPNLIDPACGSGAFLLEVCRRLLAHSSGFPNGPAGLAGAIHGMDLDPDAVLAARRSLWLTMLDAGAEPGDASLRECLAQNVRVGDVLADAALESLGGRFDVVLGNPPYRRELGTKRLLDRVAATRLGRRCRAARMDLWYYFLHRGLELLKPGGRLAFIVGSYWTAGRGAEKLIRSLADEAHVEEIFSLDRLRIFPGVSGRHMILTVRKSGTAGPTTIKTALATGPQDAEPFVDGRAPVTVFQKRPDQLFRLGRIDLEPPNDELLAKIARGVPLGQLGDVRQGIAENPAAVTARANRKHGGRWRTGEGVFALSHGELARLDLSEPEMAVARPYHDLCDLGRYYLAEEPSLALIYSTPQTCPEIDRYPALRRHLQRFRPIMEARRETRQGKRPWWQLHWPRDERLWRSGKLIAVQMARRPAFVPAPEPAYVSFSTNVFVPSRETPEHLSYFAALLNSRLMWTWYRHHAKRRGVGLELSGHVLRQTPIRRIDFSNPADRRRHDELVELVKRMTRLVRQAAAPSLGAHGLQPVGLEAAEGVDQQKLAATDRRIDELVNELCGVTVAEIP